MCKWRIAAWENSPNFATPRGVSSWNDAWETSAEIPYWWRTVPTSVYSFWLVENLLHPIRSSTLKGVKPEVYENYCKCVCFMYFFSASDQYMILGSFPPTPSPIEHFELREELLLNPLHRRGYFFWITPIRRIPNFPLGVAYKSDAIYMVHNIFELDCEVSHSFLTEGNWCTRAANVNVFAEITARQILEKRRNAVSLYRIIYNIE